MTSRLTPYSPGVVHSSTHRTRLKLPRAQCHADQAKIVKDALERVPGVRDVRVRRGGSVVIEHEERPDIIENLGEAISEAAPALIEILTEDQREVGFGLRGYVKKMFASSTKESEDDLAETSSPESLKKLVPLAFLAAGVMQLIEGEALLAGVGPIALFYWAFDSHWKFQQRELTEEVEVELLSAEGK